MSCSSSTIIIPSFLKGKSKEDLAPTTNLILLFGIVSFGMIGFYDDYKKLIQKNSDGIKGRIKFLFQIIFASLEHLQKL